MPILLIVLATWCGVLPSIPVFAEEGRRVEYAIERRLIRQPLDHANPKGPGLEERLTIARPPGTTAESPVFFMITGEITVRDGYIRLLSDFYHDAARPMIFMTLEHRGFGESTSRDQDQTVPSYVTREQAVEDAHAAVQALRPEFPGPWIGVGWSYGGSLVIEHGSRYPRDFNALLSVSGITEWSYFQSTFDESARKLLGGGLYRRLARKIADLTPRETFDETWKQREFASGLTKGLLFRKDINALKLFFKFASLFKTKRFLKVLHWLDQTFAKGEGWRYALSTSAPKVSRAEVATGDYDYRVFRYMQCTELGYFDLPSGQPSIYTRTPQDFRDECHALFGAYPEPQAEWHPGRLIGSLRPPLFYAKGGRDPFGGQQLPDDYVMPHGKFYYWPKGLHDPDDDPALASRILKDIWRILDLPGPISSRG